MQRRRMAVPGQRVGFAKSVWFKAVMAPIHCDACIAPKADIPNGELNFRFVPIADRRRAGQQQGRDDEADCFKPSNHAAHEIHLVAVGSAFKRLGSISPPH